MVRVIGLMRVKNEARWIERCVRSILPICERVLVMDDHSEDATAEICQGIPGVTVYDSPFTGINEARDKNWLLEKARAAEWIWMSDGDEELMAESIPAIRRAIGSETPCFTVKILFAWDREDQIRTDGVYRNFRRASMFRPGNARFEATAAGGNFHCGNAPIALQRVAKPLEASLLHFGYLHREDRIRKYNWYRSVDRDNHSEDGYRHIAIGDAFPADSVFKWGGPLELKELSAC